MLGPTVKGILLALGGAKPTYESLTGFEVGQPTQEHLSDEALMQRLEAVQTCIRVVSADLLKLAPRVRKIDDEKIKKMELGGMSPIKAGMSLRENMAYQSFDIQRTNLEQYRQEEAELIEALRGRGILIEPCP